MAASSRNAEVIIPPNTLRAKVCSSAGKVAITPDVLKRAEAAMEDLRQEFSGWLTKDIEALANAFFAFSKSPDPERASALFRAALDLKGQATTFEYPLIARVATSLAKLMDGMQSWHAAPVPLVAAHVDAVAVIHREKIKDISNRIALVLTEELEGRVTVTLEKASHPT